MENIIDLDKLFGHLSFQELLELRKQINCNYDGYENIIQDIRTNVNEKDHHCILEEIEIIDESKLSEEGIGMKVYNLYLDVCTTDKKNIEISGLSSNQNDWVKCLGFGYEPTNKDTTRYGFYVFEESWTKQSDDTLKGRSSIDVYIFYKKKSLPNENIEFKVLNQVGDLGLCKIIDGHINIIRKNKQYLSQPLSEFKDVDLFILSTN